MNPYTLYYHLSPCKVYVFIECVIVVNYSRVTVLKQAVIIEIRECARLQLIQRVYTQVMHQASDALELLVCVNRGKWKSVRLCL